MEKYFESCEEAEKYAKLNNIKDYVFNTPMYTETGVDMCWDEKGW